MDLPRVLSPDAKIAIQLSSGTAVELPVCYVRFSPWRGPAVDFDYGGKPLIEYQGRAVFAELAILRILIAAGWDGVWVETYGGMNFLREMPHGWRLAPQNIDIPPEKHELIRRIQEAANTTACFDVLAWKGDDVLFCEAKHSGKDRLTTGQTKFIEGALSSGLSVESLLIVEWVD